MTPTLYRRLLEASQEWRAGRTPGHVYRKLGGPNAGSAANALTLLDRLREVSLDAVTLFPPRPEMPPYRPNGMGDWVFQHADAYYRDPANMGTRPDPIETASAQLREAATRLVQLIGFTRGRPTLGVAREPLLPHIRRLSDLPLVSAPSSAPAS